MIPDNDFIFILKIVFIKSYRQYVKDCTKQFEIILITNSWGRL